VQMGAGMEGEGDFGHAGAPHDSVAILH